MFVFELILRPFPRGSNLLSSGMLLIESKFQYGIVDNSARF